MTLAVNTDSDELYRQFDASGEPYIRIPRKESLAGDTASKIDVIRDTLSSAQTMTGAWYDVVVDMDLTSPLRRAGDIKNVIDTLLNTKGAEVALSVTEARRNPYFNQLAKKSSGFFGTAIESEFVARQQAPEIFDANASLYAYSTEFLQGSNTIIIKANLAVSLMPDTAVLDIDSERDFELMGVLAEYFYSADSDFGAVRDSIKTFAN